MKEVGIVKREMMSEVGEEGGEELSDKLRFCEFSQALEELSEIVEAEETILDEGVSTLQRVFDTCCTDACVTFGFSDGTDDTSSCVIGHVRNRLC